MPEGPGRPGRGEKMIRCAIVFLFWVATLGILDIEITWADGWNIKLNGWLGVVIRRYRKHHPENKQEEER
jgi:hypothetical protein